MGKEIARVLFTSVLVFYFAVPAFSELSWILNLDEGLKKGKESKKKILASFSATWCNWCKKLKKEVFENPEIESFIEKNFVPVLIDGDKNREIVDKFKVEDFPTVLIINQENGKIVEKVVGFKSYKEFLEFLRKNGEN